jgi:adenine-specific DNA-methyltransferase
MAQANTKLELTWIGKYDEKPSAEPRLLIEDSKLSHGIVETGFLPNGKPWNGNMLIHGDNLLALKALEENYTNAVKCIYIDPPYNTGNAFEHYDDGLEHSIWLSLMRDRLDILRNLLTDDGTIWISIDADESHYLKVLCDEVFGRRNFVDEVIWQRSYAPINLKKTLSRCHDAILVYAKNKTDGFELNRLPRSTDANDRYKNPDNDPRGVWKSSDLSVGPAVQENIYPITTPTGRVCLPPEGYSWRLSEPRFKEYVADNRIWFGPTGNNVPSIKRFLTEVKDGIVATTFWPYQEVGHNQDAKKEIKALGFDSIFDTPKPEKLIERVITIASNEGDLVLDSFLGSGTTTAVAHKMKRRWIGIELGNHAYTHCAFRMNKVIDGKDPGGITESRGWKGGGGYKFYELAPSLLKKDSHGHLVINKEYNADMLAAAMAKMEGFTYEPSTETFWKQGYSSETDFIFTTTQFMTVETLGAILDTMADGESLLICCKAFQPECKNFSSRISVKKIPSVLLGRCEFDHDDYSLNIIELPQTEEIDDSEDLDNSPEAFSDDTSSEPSLF